MRFVIGIVLALSVGIGAYLGSAQVANSAKTPPRKVTLRLGDIAAFGQVQCVATTYGRSDPMRYAYLECSKGPVSRAAVSVDVSPGGGGVSKKAGHIQCFLGGPGRQASIFLADLTCNKGSRKHLYLSVKVLPSGIAVSKRYHGGVLYKTGWDPG